MSHSTSGATALDRNLLIFCKAPIPGTVKTRLIPSLGEAKATELHRQLATRTINTCMSAQASIKNLKIQLCCAPTIKHSFYHQFDITKMLQQGIDLGERMYLALAQTVTEAMLPTVLVGTDCPSLSVAYLHRAFKQLEDHDVVLGPAEDGGYGLIGLRRLERKIFTGIAWGTETVCAHTCRLLNQQKINYSLLHLLWDIDRMEDVRRYAREYGADP